MMEETKVRALETGTMAPAIEEATSEDVVVAKAVGDARAAHGAHGKPDMIYAYQESGSGNQIQTWFWVQKRTAMSFILGDKNGEVTW